MIHQADSGRFARLILVLLLLPIGVNRPCEADDAAIQARVSQDIRYLSSDELEGRGPGTRGLEIAAEYIRDEFQRLGLKSGTPDGSYRQPFPVLLDTKVIPEETKLVLRGPDDQAVTLQLGHDFQPLATGGSGSVSAPIVFAGYGISAPQLDYDDYAGVEVSNKVILVMRREPQQGDPASAFDGIKITPHAYVRTKLQEAKANQAAAILLVNDPFTTTVKKQDQLMSPNGFGTSALGIPFAHLSQAVVDRILRRSPLRLARGGGLSSVAAVESVIDTSLRPLSQPLAGWSAELEFEFEKVSADVANIVGVLEGEGPLAHETVIVGAHYDHIGYGEYGSRRRNVRAVHNGADDNASGTAAVLELARRLAHRGHKPARRVVFIAFSAEERGIVGSKYYLEHPLFPLADTVAMFNYDMIGRLRKNELIVHGVQSAREFPLLADRANGDASLKLNQVKRTLASGDHFGFYERGIPALHFFTGLTDEYHTPDDDFETINIAGVVRTIDYTERLLDLVLELPQRPQLAQANSGRPRTGGVAYLGVTPDYSTSAPGLRISAILTDSPAEKAGLKPGDIILRFADSTVTDLASLADGLRRYRPGDNVDLVIRRGQETVTRSVTLGRPQGR